VPKGLVDTAVEPAMRIIAQTEGRFETAVNGFEDRLIVEH
jgi:hypothetical protein